MHVDLGHFFLAAIVVSVVVGCWKGGEPERVGALLLVAMLGIEQASNFIGLTEYDGVDEGALLQDAFATVTFGTIALYSRRAWPLWATSLQILSLFSHLSRHLQMGMPPMAYGIMKSLPTFFLTIAIVVGTICHRRRLRRYGSDPAWKVW